jgi:hypothetical protein
MIWFSCQCGKTHGRPEAAVGATIFCECGLGVLVPWESTAAEPVQPPPVPDLPAALNLEPVAAEALPAWPGPAAPAAKPPRARKRPRVGPRDPRLCFNHEETARQTTCGDCGESFCSACLVAFAGATLCGPCKNYRVKDLQRVPPPSNLAVLSALTALLTAPVTLAILLTGHGGFSGWTVVGLLFQGLPAGLAVLALLDAAHDPKTGGVPLALTGLFTAGVTAALVFLLSWYTPPLWI